MRSRVLRILANMTFMLFSIILALGLLELVVRIVFPIYDPSGYVELRRLPDGTPIGPFSRVVRQVKNTGDYNVEVRFNSWGFRDDKILTSATDGDLFVTGDSFAFGWGVESRDRFSDLLQTILNRPIFNIAIPGTNIDDYDGLVRYARASGAKVRKLILCVTMENDLHNYKMSRPPGSLVLPTSDLLPLNLWSLRKRFANHSALFVMLTHVVHQTPWMKHIAVRLGMIIPNLEGIGDVIGADTALASSAQRLLQFVGGQETVILIVPSRRLWVGESGLRAEAARLHIAFVDSLRNSGLIVADLRARLERTGNPLSHHFANDGHWNKKGHLLAAESLAEVLQAKSSEIKDALSTDR